MYHCKNGYMWRSIRLVGYNGRELLIITGKSKEIKPVIPIKKDNICIQIIR